MSSVDLILAAGLFYVVTREKAAPTPPKPPPAPTAAGYLNTCVSAGGFGATVGALGGVAGSAIGAGIGCLGGVLIRYASED